MIDYCHLQLSIKKGIYLDVLPYSIIIDLFVSDKSSGTQI